MTPQTIKDLQTEALAIVDREFATPVPGIHAARWARIIEIDDYLRSVAAEHYLNRNRRKTKSQEIPFHETREWRALVQEEVLLKYVERAHAIIADWPIWQAHQHFQYVDNTTDFIRQGEVISFDLEAQTVYCTTWRLNDLAGYLSGAGTRANQTILIQQINEAIRRAEESEAAEQAAAAGRALLQERQKLPLFADLISATSNSYGLL